MPCIAHKSSLDRFCRSCRCIWSGGISSRSLGIGVRCSAGCSAGSLTFIIIFFVRYNVAFVDISSILDRNNIADFRFLRLIRLLFARFDIGEVVQLQTLVNDRVSQTFFFQ